MIEQGAVSTVQDCKDWAYQLESDWAQGGDESYDTGVNREEALYLQQFSPTVPEGAPGVKTGSAPADADAAVDSLTPYDVQIYVRPARAKKKWATQADLLTRFAHGLLFDWRRPTDVLALIAFDMVVRRVGVARVLYDDTRWVPRPKPHPETAVPLPFLQAFESALEAEGRKRAEAKSLALRNQPPPEEEEDDEDLTEAEWEIKYRWQNPIVLERRNPRHCKWRRTERGEILALTETKRILVAEGDKTYTLPGWQENWRRITQGLKKYEPVEVQDIWVGHDRCILVRDEPIMPGGVQCHGYPEIPYLIMPYRETSFEEPGLRYRGMLTNSRGLYEAESQVMSMHLAQLAWNAWRTFMGWLGEEVRDVVIRPGDFLRVDRRKGHWVEMMQGEPVPPELAQTVGMIDAFIQRNSVASGPRGGAEGTRSAEQVWALQSQRQLKLEPGKGALRQGVQDALRLATMIVEEFLEEPLTLPIPGKDREGAPRGEVTIRPSDIKGYHAGYEVNFGRRLDPALLEQAKTLQVFATNSWMPLHESWRLSGLTDNPQEWEDMLLQQNIDRLPWVIELAALAMTKAYFGVESPEYLRLIEKIEQQDQPGGGGGPPGAQAQPGAPGIPAPGGLEPPGGPKGPEAGGGMGGFGHQANAGRSVGARTPPGVTGGTMPQQTRGAPGY